MKKKFFILSAIFSLAGAIGCSSDDGFVGKTTNPPVEVIPDVLTVANVRSYMADPDATEETVALFYNLKKLSKTKYLIGQQDAFNGFYNNIDGDSDIKKATGYDPALLGSDFMFITDKQNNGQSNNWFYQQEQKITSDVKDAYAKGMVNIFCWHLREPYNQDTFYAVDITDPIQKANAFKSILPGGENHDLYKTKLDKVAQVLNDLKDANGKLIPVIFRPFHEFDGNWFWWGAAYCTPEEYKQVWQFTVEYLRDTKNVHNVLYAFSPDKTYATALQYLSRYPGDDYIDILGMDNYGDFSTGSTAGITTANAKLKMISDMGKEKVKIAAMTETGHRVTSATSPLTGFFSNSIYNAMTTNNVELAFVMFWANNEDGYYVPPAGQANTQDFKDFTLKGESVLQNTLPEMYVLPAQ
jgi:mannan endo-1,4-beta-mannosidase